MEVDTLQGREAEKEQKYRTKPSVNPKPWFDRKPQIRKRKGKKRRQKEKKRKEKIKNFDKKMSKEKKKTEIERT